MRKWFILGLLILMLTTVAITAVSAADPVGRCPDGFELHLATDHDDHHEHHHVGTHADRNGDGWICVSHVGSAETNHVHTDNNASN